MKTSNRAEFLAAVAETLGNVKVITRAQIIEVCEAHNLKWPSWFVNDPENRVGRGQYSIKVVLALPSRRPRPPRPRVPRLLRKFPSPTMR